LIAEQLAYDQEAEAQLSAEIKLLTEGQHVIHAKIVKAALGTTNQCLFFVNSPGGAGKSLYTSQRRERGECRC